MGLGSYVPYSVVSSWIELQLFLLKASLFTCVSLGSCLIFGSEIMFTELEAPSFFLQGRLEGPGNLGDFRLNIPVLSQ